MKKRWTNEEVRLFEQMFTDREIAAMTGRTLKAVQMKRYNLGLNAKEDTTTPGDLMAQETKEWRILSLCKRLGVKLFG